jgi:hypothetical protein
MTAYIKRTKSFQINDLIVHLKLLEKQEQAKPERSKRREIIKIRPKLMRDQKHHTKNQPNKSWFLEKKINKIDRPLENLTKMRTEKNQSVKSEMQRGYNNKRHKNPGNHQRLL